MESVDSAVRARETIDAIIGVEVHVQLDTDRKLFSPARRRHAPDTPNAFIDPLSIGLPGALPVLNRVAVAAAVRVAVALDCTVPTRSEWDRKHYFYPDLPKGYQITQQRRPLAHDGALHILGDNGCSRPIRITRVHLEEDAGKSIHRDDGSTDVDYNRAGAPLIEIVSAPDLRSPQEARRFLKRLRAVVRAVGASTAHMEQGELRCDANVSLAGESPGPRVEIKNLNSFRHVEQALAYEIERQRQADTTTLTSETRLWDASRRQTRTMRAKETSADYRYMPEPDLPAVVIDSGWVDAVRASLEELPAARAARGRQHGLSASMADALADDDALWARFDSAVANAPEHAKGVAGLLLGEISRLRNASEQTAVPVSAPVLVDLARLKAEGRISSPQQKALIERAWREKGDFVLPNVEASPWSAPERLDPLLQEVLDRHPAVVNKYRSGKVRVLGFLVGEVMKASRGQADPPTVKQRLEKRLKTPP